MADTSKPRTSRSLPRRQRGTLTNRSPAKALRLHVEQLEERLLLSISACHEGPIDIPPELASFVSVAPSLCSAETSEPASATADSIADNPGQVQFDSSFTLIDTESGVLRVPGIFPVTDFPDGPGCGPLEFCVDPQAPVAPPQTEIHPDLSFGDDGRVTTTIGSYGEATTLLVQPDGKIIAAGYGSDGAVLARYNTDGSLDTTFGDAGVSMLGSELGSEWKLVVADLALQADGKIVITGFSWELLDFVTTRFTAEGQLDSQFGVDGIAQTDLGEFDGAQDIAIQPDGKILVAGFTDSGQSILIRYHSDGSLDGTFGNGGVVHGSISSARGSSRTIAIQTDGRILMVGPGELHRYNTDGTLDTSFGTGGTIDRGGARLVLQDDGKIVVLRKTELARYHSDGSLDLEFGGMGVVRHGFRFSDSHGASDLAVDEQGNIVVVGGGLRVARFSPDGSPDGSTIPDFSSRLHRTHAVAIQTDGSIVVAGAYRTEAFEFALARFQVIEPGEDSGTDNAAPQSDSQEVAPNETTEATSESDGFLALAPEVFDPVSLDAVSAQQTEPDTPRPDAVLKETVDLALSEITSDDNAPVGIDSLGGSGEEISGADSTDEVLADDLLPLLPLVNLAIGISG